MTWLAQSHTARTWILADSWLRFNREGERVLLPRGHHTLGKFGFQRMSQGVRGFGYLGDRENWVQILGGPLTVLSDKFLVFTTQVSVSPSVKRSHQPLRLHRATGSVHCDIQPNAWCRSRFSTSHAHPDLPSNLATPSPSSFIPPADQVEIPQHPG